MARDRSGNGASPESVISIIGPGMRVVGECATDGTLRIEGSIQGTVRAGKAVVVGKDEGKPSDEDLTAFVKTRLASYKAPSQYEWISEPLPRNHLGKLLKNDIRDRWGVQTPSAS